MQSHQSGGPMGSSFQEIQKMQRMQHQMQAQFRQQAAGQRQSQQVLNGGNLSGLQGLPQLQQTQFSNQQWMDQTQQQMGGQGQRNSLGGMTNPAMAMIQQQTQSGSQSMGIGGNSAKSYFWNSLQGSKGSSSGMGSGMDASGPNASLGALGGMGMGSGSGKLGMMDGSMQALLQQQGGALNMGNNQQNQMRSHMGQQQMSGGKNDISNSMGMINPQQMSQLRKMGSSSSLLATSGDLSGQMHNTGNTSAQLLMQQQSMIADLQRQLQGQQSNGGNSGSSGSSSVLPPNLDRRSSSSAMIQNQQLLQMQQRGGNPAMFQPFPGMQDQNIRNGSSFLQGQQCGNNMQNMQNNQRKGSMSSTEPISLASLMGQGQQGGMGMSQNNGNSQGNSFLGMFDGNGNSPGNTNVLMQHQAQLQQMAKSSGMDPFSNTTGNSRSTSMNDQFFAQQQQQLLGASGMGSMGQDMQKAQQLLSQPGNQLLGQSGNGSTASNGGGNGYPMKLQQDIMAGLKGSDGTSDTNPLDAGDKSGGNAKGRRSSRSSGTKRKAGDGDQSENPQPSGQQSFLDGTFVGGWQSNADIPDRRRVIYSICKVIEQTRPDANKMPQKLPFVAKRLEEHLYRSAKTKEEYLDPSTLKKRLQTIAHDIEEKRTTSTTKKDSKGTDSQGSSSQLSGDMGLSDADISSQKMQQHMRQLQQFQQLEQQRKMGNSIDGSNAMMMKLQEENKNDLGRQHSNSLPQTNMGSSASGDPYSLSSVFSQGFQPSDSQLQEPALGSQQSQLSQRQSSSSKGATANPGILKTSSSKYQDPQKRKVIKQQQQRLLLLRHASKCKAGPDCKVKFCGQMVALWKHMKKCRDKNCKTAHCLSSRCVLNHYRTCKSENKTSTCEVCGPVMRQIKQQNNPSHEDNSTEKDTSNPSTCTPAQQSGSGSNMWNQNASTDSSNSQKRPQLEELQAAQQKLQQQHALLKQLQGQQAQLLEQQKQLQLQQQHVLPQTQQGQQLQQQQALLQELQQEFHLKQMPLQQELLRQSQALQSGLGGDVSQPGASTSLPNPGVVEPGKFEAPKLKRRTSTVKRNNKKGPERQPTLPGKGQGVRQRAGKGKRLSALESQIPSHQDDGERSTTDKDGDSFDELGLSNKRSADEISPDDIMSSGGGRNKAIKLEESDHVSSISAHQRSERADGADGTSGQEKVLQQGNEDNRMSLVPSMSPAAIDEHLDSLKDSFSLNPKTISQKCIPIIRRLVDDQFGWVFRDPVDPDVLGLPDYYEVVKTPMHLSLIEKKLENSIYKDMESFERDTKLVFENAILYNGEDSEVGEMAQSMIDRFEKDFGTVVNGIKADREKLTRNGDICSLCGVQRRHFQPAVLRCNGACGMQKIRRGDVYYTNHSKSNHWCVPCYGKLKDDQNIVLDDGTSVSKGDLQHFKNDALPEEAWVQCDHCRCWVHQICALFSGRKSKSSAPYACPKCHVSKGPKVDIQSWEETVKTANDLPHCKMSISIEKGLAAALMRKYEESARERGVTLDQIERANGLSIRVISNMDKVHAVRDQMLERYSSKGYPTEFPVRSKCIALFQKIHGVDVLLFGVYVYEYNEDCPAPNRKRVYISYLDSVQYFQPKCYRTFVYQRIIVEYLRYVKDRGFHTAHIWSCPPSSGDDYIFHCHPTHQLIPRDDMLRAWYFEMLEKAKAEGVVLGFRSLYDEYFKNGGMDATSGPASDPTCLPYFEGDYIPGEIENILNDLKSEEHVKREGWDGSQPRGEPGKKLGTRSNPGSLVGVGPDKVVLRLGEAINNMRHNFMVVHLKSRAFAAAVERGEDVSGWIDETDETSSKKARISGKDSSLLYPPHMMPKARLVNLKHEANSKGGMVPVATNPNDPTAGVFSSQPGGVVDGSGRKHNVDASKSPEKNGQADDEVGSLGTVSVSLDPNGDDDNDPVKAFGAVDGESDRVGASVKREQEKDDLMPIALHLDQGPTSDQLKGSLSQQSQVTLGSSSKRGFDEIEPTISRHFAAVRRKSTSTTLDEDEPRDVEMFESRQQFLNYCQANHFQFDELRRAKHTTMMVLFHLHNPDAPKFLPPCGIREKMKRRRQQQQLSDDRRRQAQNQLYRGSSSMDSLSAAN